MLSIFPFRFQINTKPINHLFLFTKWPKVGTDPTNYDRLYDCVFPLPSAQGRIKLATASYVVSGEKLGFQVDLAERNKWIPDTTRRLITLEGLILLLS